MGKIIKISDSIILKQIELSDAQDIFNVIDLQREYLGKWLPFVQITNKMESTENYIKSVINAPEDKREYNFVIHHEGEFVGIIGFKDTDKINCKTEIGYWLSENFQKKGIMTRSVLVLCKFAFEELKMNRIQIKVAVGNTSSKKIPQRLNFKFEGIERDGEKMHDGSFADIEVFSLLRREL